MSHVESPLLTLKDLEDKVCKSLHIVVLILVDYQILRVYEDFQKFSNFHSTKLLSNNNNNNNNNNKIIIMI